MNKIKATIYHSSEFTGRILKTEVYLLKHYTREYAQYKNAVCVEFIPKGKRKPRRIIKGYRPYILILKDWNNIDPDSGYKIIKNDENVIIRESKYNSFDDNYKKDFDNIINNYDVEIIADYRYFNTYTKF